MKLVRLSSGEEIIGDVEEIAGAIKIKNGFSLIPAGEGRLGFMPFMAYTEADKGITISDRFVVFVVTPKEELIDNIRQMKSGIAVLSNKIVT